MSAFRGLDDLFTTHKDYNAQLIARVYRGVPKPAHGILPITPGRKWRNLEPLKRAFRDREHLYRVHLTNQWAVRSGLGRRGDLLRSWTLSEWNRRLKDGDRKITRRLRKHTDIIAARIGKIETDRSVILGTIGLEDALHDDAAKAFRDIVEPHWPWKLGRNKVGKTASRHSWRGFDFVELHNPDAKFDADVPREQRFLSFDGIDLELPQGWHQDERLSITAAKRAMRDWSNEVFAVLLWIKQHQNDHGNLNRFIGPRRRRLAFYPENIGVVNEILTA